MNLAWLHPILALTFAPMLIGVINRTKALVAGRCGPSLWQPYLDLLKLARKGAVYSRTTTWVFRAGPVVGLAAVLAALLVLPFGSGRAVISFSGDFVVLAGLLALGRWFTVLAALDTGSSFEGMGASREVQFAALVEPGLLLALAAVARLTGELSLGGMLAGAWLAGGGATGPVVVLVAGTLLVVLLTENARIPVDDPATHLELTMIHEAMVLDHGGPDLALIHYGAALKIWVTGTLLAGLLLPMGGEATLLNLVLGLGGLLLVALAVGLIESTMARLRLVTVPQLLAASVALASVAFILVLGYGH